MSAVLFLVTIPTEEEEERLKNDYITRKIESKSLKSETNTIKANNNDTKSDAVSVQIEPSAPIVKSVHYSDTFPRRKSEADSLLAFDGSANCNDGGGDGGDGDADNVTTKAASKGQESNGSVKSDNTEQQINCAELRRKSIEGFRDMITSAKRKTSIKPINTDLDLPYDACMEKVLKEILTKLEVMNVIWTKDLDGKTFQVTFSIEVNKVYEDILKKLNEWGIGDREGSSVTVLNCIASKKFAGNFDSEEDLFANGGDKFQEESAWDRFMDTVRSRLNVVQVVNNVRQDASITFDFCVMVVCAAILAAFGLVDDSTIFLAASMLISPLMGPIIASIFGTVIKDVSLRMLGIKNELFGLSLALSVGFIFGLILCGIDDRYSRGEGLSVEMLSRCELRSLLVGVFTAIPSGAAVAVAILGGNIGSLVGVAISASLLPPAVNTGILWSIACVYKFYEYDDSRYSSVIKEPKYSQNQAAELAILGSISMCLTIVNIICIYVMGILMLKMKEIAPISTKQTTTSFWKHDVKIARNLQKTGYNTDQCLIDEFTNLPQSEQKALGINADILRSIQVDEAQYQNTWSPIARHTLMDSYHDNQATVNGLERLYATIHNQKPYRPYVRQFSYGRPLDRVSEIVRPYNRLSDHFPRRATMPTKAMQEATIPENVTNSTSTLKSNMTTPTGTGDLSKRRKFIVTPAQVDPFSKDAEK